MADMFDKEELSIVGSLFGASPEAMQIAREKAAFTQGTQAGQNLLGGILGNVGMFAERGAAGLRGGLGVQLPEERIAGLRQQATQQFDTSTPEGLMQMAQFLNQQGDAAGARQAIMVAQGQQQRMATLGQTMATTEAKLREPLPNIARLQAYRTNLVAQFGENDPRVKEVDKVIAAEGEGKGTKITNVMDTRGKAFEAADTETLKKVRTEAGAASGQLFLIAQARENLPRAVVGQGLPAIIRGLNAQLAPLGINTEQVANTRNLEQALKSIIAQGIKQYGANPSTVDLQFAVSAAADIKDPIQAINATLNYLEKRAKATINKADAADKYLETKGNLAGFEKQWAESQTIAKPKTRTLKSGIVVTEED